MKLLSLENLYPYSKYISSTVHEGKQMVLQIVLMVLIEAWYFRNGIFPCTLPLATNNYVIKVSLHKLGW